MVLIRPRNKQICVPGIPPNQFTQSPFMLYFTFDVRTSDDKSTFLWGGMYNVTHKLAYSDHVWDMYSI